MIKKITLFVIILLIAIMPITLADAGPAPKPAQGKYIDIKVRLISEEVKIGEQAALEITITNMTKYKVRPISMYFGIAGANVDHSPENIIFDGDRLEIGAYQSLTFELRDIVDKGVDYYQKDGEYYVDITSYVQFFLGEGEDYFYQEGDRVTPVKISNLFEGSEYIEIEWLDSRDVLYYNIYSFYVYDGSVSNYYEGGQNVIVSVRNISDIELSDLQPNEVKVENIYISEYISDINKIKSTYLWTYKHIFELDGDYYVTEAQRTYRTDFIEPPVVNLEIVHSEGDEDAEFSHYKFIVTNPNEYTIENLFFVSNNDKLFLQDDTCVRYGDIKPGESWKIISTDSGYNTLHSDVRIGYLINGELYIWSIKSGLQSPEVGVYAPVETVEHCSMFDYDYRINEKKYLEMVIYSDSTPTPAPTVTPTNEITAEPTIVPTASPVPAETEAPTVTVTKRRNPMIWALAIVALLLAGALVFVIRAIKKVGEDKSND